VDKVWQKSSKEGSGSKSVVLPMKMMMMMIHFISQYRISQKSVQRYSSCLHSDWQTNMADVIGSFCYFSLRIRSKMNTKKVYIKKETHNALRTGQGGNEVASPFCFLMARNP
jgi:hypothetical protein